MSEVARVAGVFALALVVSNAAVWFVSRSITDRPIDVVSEEILDLRLERGDPIVMLGDSVVFGENLRSGGGERWFDRALPARLEAIVQKPVTNLGINGVLFSDLDCVIERVLDREIVVLNVSPRPFATELKARPFLCKRAHVIPVLRYREALQQALLGSTPTAALLGAVKKALTKEHDDDEEEKQVLERIVLQAKAAARLDSIQVVDTGTQAEALRSMIGRLKGRRALIFYLEEDLSGIPIDKPRFLEQRAKFVAQVQALAGGSVRFVVIPATEMTGLYDDHVHLTPDGYAKLATILAEELKNAGD